MNIYYVYKYIDPISNVPYYIGKGKGNRCYKHLIGNKENKRFHNKNQKLLSQGINPIIETGKKYHKIVSVRYGDQRSVHAFVDMNTGEVYKSASWKTPAKGVRFNLMDEATRNLCYNSCDIYGSYLYRR